MKYKYLIFGSARKTIKSYTRNYQNIELGNTNIDDAKCKVQAICAQAHEILVI
jgi:hypothetical protein